MNGFDFPTSSSFPQQTLPPPLLQPTSGEEKLSSVSVSLLVGVLFWSPFKRLWQRASVGHLGHLLEHRHLPQHELPCWPPASAAGAHLLAFKRFHQEESLLHLVGSSILNLFSDGLLTVLCFSSVRSKGELPEPVFTISLENALFLPIRMAILLPVRVAIFQFDHNIWRGWRQLFRLRNWKALPTMALGAPFFLVNSFLQDFVYDLLGRPFSKARSVEEEEEEAEGMSQQLPKLIGHQVVTRTIVLGSVLLTSLIYLPLSTITNSLIVAPDVYNGPIDCAQKILAAEGWQGFYKGLWWHTLKMVCSS